MDMQALMPNRQPQLNSDKKKRLPCCNKKNKSEPWLDGTLNTEYRKEFIDKEVPQERATRTFGELKNPGKFDGTTTNQVDYQPYQISREQMIRPVHSQAVEGLPFNGDSTYASQYGAKEVAYARVRPSNAYQPNQGEFYGNTTYKGDFKESGVPLPVRKMMQAPNLVSSGAPFEGASVYKDNFTKQMVARREAVAPKSSSDILPRGNFDGNTMYTSSYIPKEISTTEKFRPHDARPMSRSGWYGGMPSTEYGGQFIDKETPQVEKAKGIRGGDIMTKGPFDGTTTNKTDFQPYAVSTKDGLIKPIHAMEAEKLPFNGESTYHGAFISKDVPYARVRPSNAYVPNPAVFDGSTTNKANFVNYGVMPVFRGGPSRASAFGKDGKPVFEGQSTYKANFTKMPGGPRTKALVTSSQPIRSGPFDGATTYRNDFVEKEIPVREPDCRECDSCEEDD